jgi:hypothetical protein
MENIQLKYYEGQTNYVEFFTYLEKLFDWRNDDSVLLRRRPQKKKNAWTLKSIKQDAKVYSVEQNYLRRRWYNWWRYQKQQQ